MDELNRHEEALALLNAISNKLHEMHFKHDKDESTLSIIAVTIGDDLPFPLHMHVVEELRVISVDSMQPFSVPEKSRVDMAVAIPMVNCRIAEGSFHYDITDGTIIYHMTVPYVGTEFTEKMVTFITLVCCKTVDEYNDKLKLLADGAISIEQFADIIKSDRDS